jgi:hypothetical protein
MRFRLPTLFLALLVAFAGCDSTNTGASDDTGTLRVLLTDAPGDFLAAVVTIEQVYLQAEEGDDDPEDGRTILSDDQVTVDLLTLQNEVLAIVENEEVPAGTYHQLRLVISGGFIEVEDEDGGSTIYASSDEYAATQGVEADGRLQMPSYAQSGLKIVLPDDLAEIADEEQIVLIDFNVAESFGQQAGQSGMWVMRPVVRATDLAFTGTAAITLALDEGVALPDDLILADFSAALDKNGEIIEVPFADEDEDSLYSVEFRYLAPGTYPIDLVAPEGVTVETDVELSLDLLIESGGTTDADIVITSVEVE